MRSIKNVHCIIFSISVDFRNIRECILELESQFPLMILTPHYLFDFEQKFMRICYSGEIIFKSFADFISDEEAVNCDYEAYKSCIQAVQTNLGKYYDEIKTRKNKAIMGNILEQYTLKSGYVFSNDLGIDKDVWLEKGFIDKTAPELPHLNQPRPTKYHNVVKYGCSWLNQLFAKKSNFLDRYCILRYNGVSYLFCGNISRVQQFLKKDVTIERLRVPIIARFFIGVPRLTRKIKRKILIKVIKKNDITEVLSSMHEHIEQYREVARWAGIEYRVIQDGYIPENYLPYFYKLAYMGANYYVFDTLSAELFVMNQMQVAIFPLYKVRELPEIKQFPETIKTILVLTSGAGDWTAVKNRSDDDLMLMAFVEIARVFQNINIIYRCHPLWVHPTHQGENSIKRAVEYLKSTSLENIKISSGSLMESERYSNDRHLFVEPKSTMDDIAKADLVFGEHSYSMIDAAGMGKLFGSVLIANRRDYFINYTKLGFFHFTSHDDITAFIKELGSSPGKILDKHNAAIRRYNKELNN